MSLFIFLFLSGCSSHHDKTVFLAILARNKAHALPKFLKSIEDLDYDKKAITLYINTNNNIDETEEVLKTWAAKHQSQYRNIIFESHHVQSLENDQSLPHDWNLTRFQALAKIRNQSLKKAIEDGADYYFVIDCDVFINPKTLKILMSKQKPIIAPMMRTYPANLIASTYWSDLLDNGWPTCSPFYFQILNRDIRGTFPVPLVHCVYLIESKYLPYLNYLSDAQLPEFMIFSQSARKAEVQQYICNEEDFGIVYFEDQFISLEDEKNSFQQLFCSEL